MTTCGSSVAVAAARFCMTSVRRSGDITSTMLDEVAVGGDDRRRLRGEHRRAVRRVLRRDDVAARARRSPRRRRRSRAGARCMASSSDLAPIRDGADDRAPQIVLAAGGMLDLPILEDAGEIDLLDRDRGVSLLAPRPWPGRRARGRASMSSASKASSALEASGPARRRRTRAAGCRGGGARRAASVIGPSRRRPAMPAISSVSGVTPKVNTWPFVAAASAVRRRSTDVRDRRVLGRVERPAAGRRDERPRERQDAARELR